MGASRVTVHRSAAGILVADFRQIPGYFPIDKTLALLAGYATPSICVSPFG